MGHGNISVSKDTPHPSCLPNSFSETRKQDGWSRNCRLLRAAGRFLFTPSAVGSNKTRFTAGTADTQLVRWQERQSRCSQRSGWRFRSSATRRRAVSPEVPVDWPIHLPYTLQSSLMMHLPRTSETSLWTRPHEWRHTVQHWSVVSKFRWEILPPSSGQTCVNGLTCKTHSFGIYGSLEPNRESGNLTTC